MDLSSGGHIVEEDSESRDMAEVRASVIQALEEQDELRALRVQLKAAVFANLLQRGSGGAARRDGAPGDRIRATQEGRLLAGLVEEYLEFHGMRCSKSIFRLESGAAATATTSGLSASETSTDRDQNVELRRGIERLEQRLAGRGDGNDTDGRRSPLLSQLLSFVLEEE